MKQQDVITKLKDSTYSHYQQSDGLIDMLFGLALFCVWWGFHLQFVLFFFVLIPIIPFAFVRIRRKLVYPRVGFAVFSDRRPQNRIFTMGLYALFSGLGLIILFWFQKQSQLSILQHPFFNAFCISISALLIFGSITQKQLFYAIAIGLAWPSISSLVTQQEWFGMPLHIVFNGACIGFMVWLLSYKKPIVDKEAAKRANLVIHSSFMIIGMLGFLYVIMFTYYPTIAVAIKQAIKTNPAMVYAGIISLLFLCVGIAFREIRFYLYAIMVWLAVIDATVLTHNVVSIPAALAVLGGVIMLVGLWLFLSFLKRYPILQEKEDVPAEI